MADLKFVRVDREITDPEDGVDPIWSRIAAGRPTSDDVVQLLMVGGIPGVCGPGRTAKERETILSHSRNRLGIVNSLWGANTVGAGHRRTGQTRSNDVDYSEEELMDFFGQAFPSNSRRRISPCVFVLYLLAFVTHAGWMCFAVPSKLSNLEELPAFLGGEWLASAHEWFDAPDWVWWMSFSAAGIRALVITSALIEPEKKTANTSAAWSWLRFLIFGILWDMLMVLYLRRTNTSVNNWDSDAISHRVGTFFLVLVGVVMMIIWLLSIFNANSSAGDEDENDAKIQVRTIAIHDWNNIKRSANSVLQVKDATWQLEKGAGVVEMLLSFPRRTNGSNGVNLDQMAKCLFELVDSRNVKRAVEFGIYVTDKYATTIWLCINALALLPEDQRNPTFALSTICSYGVTVYDCFSSMKGWYVVEPALAPVIASTTGREKLNTSIFPDRHVKTGSSAFRIHKGRRTTLMSRAYVETSSRGETGPSFASRGEGFAGRPYPSNSVDVRVSIPTRPQPFISKPEHTGLLGLVNTAAAVWFLVHWEPDAYHAFLAAAVCGEAWAQLWIWIWWCAGEAPLTAFVDPVHWLVGRRENVPDGAVRLLAGEASAAVLGVVAALSVIDNYIAGGVIGSTAVVVGTVLKKLLKRGEDLAVVCFLAYLSELILEVVIVVTGGNFNLVTVVLGVSAALESMILTIRLLQVLIGRSLIGKSLPEGTMLTQTRESWFAHSVACGYWGAVFTGYSPAYIMEAVCSGKITQSKAVVARAKKVGYEEALHTESMRSDEEPGWGYTVSVEGENTATAWGLKAGQGFTVFEVGALHGKRYPCL